MDIRQEIALLAIVLCSACSINHHQLYEQLPEKDKELYARSKQFMTDNQQEKFLIAKDSKARVDLIESLHILDRLKKFPPYVRDAIMAQKVVPGMNSEAVLLSWGRPQSIDRRDQNGLPAQCWHFERPDKDGSMKEHRVYFLEGKVTETVLR